MRVDHHETVKRIDLDLVGMDHRNAQKADHGQVVRAFDDIDVGEVHARYPPPEQPFDCDGTGNRVGIRIDGDQDMIIYGKLFIEPV